MNSIEDYWPTLAGILAVMLGAVLLWPGEKVEEPLRVGMIQQEMRGEPVPPSAEDGEDEQVVLDGRAAGETEPLPSDVEYRAYPIPVYAEGAGPGVKQHNQDDPEVKAALAQVQVTLYEADWCGVCRRAREYLTQNRISFTSRNVEGDPNVKEQARRLSGGSNIPVIVVDGEVLRGFSEGSVQAALTRAVKQRVTLAAPTLAAP